jgi:hypothetical protein
MISLDTELKEIVELTPDYQNVDVDFSHYERMAAREGETRRAGNLMWNDFVDSADMLYSYLKKNPSVSEKFDGNLVRIVDSVYGDKLNDQSKKGIVHTLRKISTLDALSDDVGECDSELPDYFHGTGSGAFNGICKDEKLLSEMNLKEAGKIINSGEGYLNRKLGYHSFVSFSLNPARAINTHAYIDGISKIGDFPVVLGFDRSRVEGGKSFDEVYTFHADFEPEEVCVSDEVSMGAATHVYAPLFMKSKVDNFASKYDLKFVPIESLQKSSAVKFDVFRF